MGTCEKCGIPIRYRRLCCACAAYKRKGGVWYQPSPFGEVVYNEEGQPICHICGMAYDKLMEHAKRKHHLTAEEYRQEFGLMRKIVRLTSPKYADKMRELVEEKPTYKANFAAVQQGLIPNGRRDPHWSPQEIESRRAQQSEKGKKRWLVETPEQRAKNAKIWTKNLPNKKAN